MNKLLKFLPVFCVIPLVFVAACAVAGIIIHHHISEQRGLIFTLFRQELQKASDDFYSEYLSDNPLVYNYSGKIISLTKSEDGYRVKFGIEPVLGPHDPVGYDEAEYFVDNSGTISLLSFVHRKNYDIPARLNVTIKKPIPTS